MVDMLEAGTVCPTSASITSEASMPNVSTTMSMLPSSFRRVAERRDRAGDDCMRLMKPQVGFAIV